MMYSRLPITRTFKRNRKKFEFSGARRKLAGRKEKNSFYCTVSILITFRAYLNEGERPQVGEVTRLSI